MKKVIFVTILLLVAVCVHAQVAPEYQWIIGRWEGRDESGNLLGNLIFYEDGTGKLDDFDIIFHIKENLLSYFIVLKNPTTNAERILDRNDVTILKINNRRMLFVNDEGTPWCNYNKTDN